MSNFIFSGIFYTGIFHPGIHLFIPRIVLEGDIISRSLSHFQV